MKKELRTILLFQFYLSNIFTTSAIGNNLSKIRNKREVNTLIICDNGAFTARCKYGTTVYINSAIFGRQSITSVCSREGLRKDKKCTSKTVLEKIKNECKGKSKCTMNVNSGSLGYPMTDIGENCLDTSIYLELKYSCEKDCNAPYVAYNVEVIGSHNIGSTVKIACRTGYERYDGKGYEQKVCLSDGTWEGGSVLCRDIDECMRKSTNRCHRHAKCINSKGSYSCTCLDNYSGDGFTCTSDSWFDTELNGFGNKTIQDYYWDEADLDIHDEKLCGSRILRLRRGTIKSPLFPRFYPAGSSCTWVLIAPPGLVVELVFTKFSLEKQQLTGCTRDNVTMYDGISKNPLRYIGSYCGDKLPPKILSESNQLRVEFRADTVGNFPGFEAVFSARNLKNECKNFGSRYYTGVVIENGNRNGTTKPGENITLVCDQGFRKISKEMVRYCLDDGQWDNIENPCRAISCGPPPLPSESDGLFIDGNPEEYAFGKLPVRYACEDGFRLRLPTGSDGLIYCDKRGEWSNAFDEVSPTCERIQCIVTENDVPSNTAVTWVVYDAIGNEVAYPVDRQLPHGSSIEYGCKKGFALVSEKVRTCSENGWSGRNALCEEDNGISGLSNLQIAIIAAAISGAVIIIVGIGLVMCCIRNKKKRRSAKQAHHRRMRGARDNDGFVMNFANYPYQGTGGPRPHRGSSFAGRHNNLSAYTAPPPPTLMQTQSVAEHDEFYNRAIAPRTNLDHRYSLENRPTRTNQTFLATGEIRAPQQPSAYIDPHPTERGGSLPMPQGYQDPPPSYDTMLKSSKSKTKSSMKSSKRKKKNKY